MDELAEVALAVQIPGKLYSAEDQRSMALSIAAQVYGGMQDHQQIIRAARDILLFLKDG